VRARCDAHRVLGMRARLGIALAQETHGEVQVLAAHPRHLVVGSTERRGGLEGDALLAFEDDAQAPEPAVGWVLRLNPIDLSASSMSGLITRAPIRLACPLTGGLPAGGHGGLVASVAQANVLVVFGAT
jgi:hypothetical protein